MVLVIDMADIPVNVMKTLTVNDTVKVAEKTSVAYAKIPEVVVVGEEDEVIGKIVLDEITQDTPVFNLLKPLDNVVYAYENAKVLLRFFQNPHCLLVHVLDENNKLHGAVSRHNRALGMLKKIDHLIPAPDIFDAILDAIIIIDSSATIIFANHAYSKLTGVSVGKIIGKKMYDVEPTSRCLGVLRGDSPLVNKRILIESVWIEVVASITPVYNNGEKVAVVSVFRNLDETIRLSMELKRMENVAKYLQNELEMKNKLPKAFDSIVGKNSNFLEVLALASQVAPTNTTVLIRGDNGVGKELVAQAIHKTSRRKDRPLIRVNCAAIPETLLESELFGYEEGAFTGAQKGGKLGKFELADSGTLFLDEVGDMSIAMQAKLLRVLQEKEIQKIGGDHTIRVDVRVISATNKDLEAMVKEGKFREDLYYRLNVMPVTLPSLKERKDDIPLLVDYFNNYYGKEHNKEDIVISGEVMEIFLRYQWPGNIRELQNIIEHAVILCNDGLITERHLPSHLRKRIPMEETGSSWPGTLSEKVAVLEKKVIIEALRVSGGNKTKAIEMLGTSRRSFYNKLKKYKIGSQ